jgi:hypothetical protein
VDGSRKPNTCGWKGPLPKNPGPTPTWPNCWIDTAEPPKLAEARRLVNAAMRREHVTVQQGRIVTDKVGEPILDDGPLLDAARTLVNLLQRESRLVGADAPQKLEAAVTQDVSTDGIELLELLRERQTHNAAERERLSAEDSEK